MVSIQSQCSYCLSFLHCALSLVVQCIVIGLHQSGSVGAGSDHLQLIKFWWSCAPGKGSAPGGGEFWLCLTTAIVDSVCLWGTAAGAQCLRLSEHFFISLCYHHHVDLLLQGMRLCDAYGVCMCLHACVSRVTQKLVDVPVQYTIKVINFCH